MFDNGMNGAVGFAMHEDRLAIATRNLRLMEAEAATKRQQVPVVGERRRLVMAKLLIAWATRLAPTVIDSPRSTRALAQ
jgi:hypothetical protein